MQARMNATLAAFRDSAEYSSSKNSRIDIAADRQIVDDLVYGPLPGSTRVD